MQRNVTAALGAALTTMAPAGAALAAPPGPDHLPAQADPLALRTQVHGPGSIEHRMHVHGHGIAVHRRLLAENLALTRKATDPSHRAEAHHARAARRWSNTELGRANHRLRRSLRSGAGATTGVAPGTLAAIRSCESGGDYRTNTGNGFYGAYQFTQSTWASVGGSGSPANASPAEQDRRAAILYSRSGAGQWPVCGR